MKRVLSILLSMVMIVSSFAVSAVAESYDVTITGLVNNKPAAKVAAGGTALVEWVWTLSDEMIDADQKIGAFDIKIAFDSNIFELCSQDETDSDNTELAVTHKFDEFADEPYNYPGAIMLWNTDANPVFGGMMCLNGVGYRVSGLTWFDCLFRVKEDAPLGKYEIALTVNPLVDTGLGDDMASLTSQIVNCTINVVEPYLAVEEMINNLPEIKDLDYKDKADVEATRAAYNALSAEQKEKFDATVLEELEGLESQMAKLVVAKGIDDIIEAMDKNDIAEIKAARAAYNGMDLTCKRYVKKLDVLKAAERAIYTMDIIGNNQTVFSGQQATVQWVWNINENCPPICAVNGNFSYDESVFDLVALGDGDFDDDSFLLFNPSIADNYDYIKAVNSLFGLFGLSSTDGIGNLINDDWFFKLGLKVRDDAPTGVYTITLSFDDVSGDNYESIGVTIAQATVTVYSSTAYVGIKTDIDALPSAENIDLSYADEVAGIRAAYDKLLDGEKELITNYDKLVACESRINDLTAAKNVDDLIAAISDTMSVELGDYLDEVFEAYSDLTDEQKELVTKTQMLFDAIDDYNLYIDAAKDVYDKIDALPSVDEITLAQAQAVEIIKNAYDNLFDDQKALVENIDKLNAIVEKLNDMSSAKAVDDIIDLIGDPVTINDESSIVAARKAFEALSDGQKGYVEKYTILDNAEQALAAIKADMAVAKTVDDLIDEIDEIITLDSESGIVAAREAFEALTDTQKLYVTRYDDLVLAEVALAAVKDDIAAALAVDDMIDGIGEVTLEKESAIVNARAALDNLTSDQRRYVKNEMLLIEAEIALEVIKADAMMASIVDEKINAIGEVTIDSENDILLARSAYDLLSDEQKGYVKNLDVLIAAEQRLGVIKSDIKLAQEVDDIIQSIGVVTVDSEDAITAARAAFDALTDEQKGYVTKLDILQAAEDEYERLLTEVLPDAAEVDVLIENIGEVTIDSENDILLARSAYDLLTDEQKGYVKNLDVLIAAEQRLGVIKTDIKLAQEVDDIIQSIGIVTVDSENAIAVARAAFDALTDEQKGYVTKLDILQDAEDEYERLLTEVLPGASEVDGLIENIGEVTIDSENDILLARSAYDLLTDEQKGYVKNLDVLIAAEQRLGVIKSDIKLAQEVDDIIQSIGIVTVDSENAITAARAAFDELTDEQKGYVKNLDVLIAAEQRLGVIKSDIKLAQEVDDIIQNIGIVTVDSEDAITAARAAFDALTDEQKGYVTKLDILQAAEDEYERLMTEVLPGAAEVDGLIENIGEVTLDKEQIINDARAAFDALTDEQKGYVKNLDVLIAAEIEFVVVVDRTAAQFVMDMIDGIGEVNEYSGLSIQNTNDAYDALTDAQKQYVDNYDKLTAANAAYQTILNDVAVAQNVMDMMEAIGEVTLEREDYIIEVRMIYDNLTQSQKDRVFNAYLLDLAEMRIDEIKSYIADAQAVKDMIDALGEITLDKENDVIAAREAYDVLFDEYRYVVDNYETLLAAENILNDKKLAKTVEDMIGALGEITLEKSNEVVLARFAYDMLTQVQKDYVTNYETLLVAERDITGLTESQNVNRMIADLNDVNELTYDDAFIVDYAKTIYDGLSDLAKEYVKDYDKLIAAINAVKIESISVAKVPDKTVYALNELLDSTGFVLEVTTANGNSTEVVYGYVFSELDSQTVGTKTITVMFEGFETEFDVVVSDQQTEDVDLEALISQAYIKLGSVTPMVSNLLRNFCTLDSAAAFVEALSEACVVLDDVNADTVKRAAAYEKLSAAMSSLVYDASAVVDKQAAEQFIAAIGEINDQNFIVKRPYIFLINELQILLNEEQIVPDNQDVLNSAVDNYNSSVNGIEYGNIDQNEYIDSVDALMVLQYAVGGLEVNGVRLTSTVYLLADVNGDGSVDSIDSLWILRLSTGMEEYFPVN